MYIVRLDDAADHMNTQNWIRIKAILDKYGVKPIYGIIPNNQDMELLQYEEVPDFWKKMQEWQSEGWTPAMHGYTHVFETKDGGMNPVNPRSEFAGLSFETQCEKIKKGYRILKDKGINAEVFFAPAHTFDENTLRALYMETPIRIISDTIANDVYQDGTFWFIPQQSGRARRLPFKTVTFCYHPNIMDDDCFEGLERFLHSFHKLFIEFNKENVMRCHRKFTIIDRLLRDAYLMIR